MNILSQAETAEALIAVPSGGTSMPNQCPKSPDDGKHYWDTAGFMEQSIEKFVCRFCLEVIYD